MFRRLWLVLFWALCTPAMAAAPASPRITLIDGDAVLLVGKQALRAEVGAALADATVLETAAGASLVRVEWPDGSLLDLGPATRLMLAPPRQLGDDAAFYLLLGWAKLSQPGDSKKGWASPNLLGQPVAVAGKTSVVVVWAQADQTRVFAEAGGQGLVLRADRKPAALAAGHELAFGADRRIERATRATPVLLADLPAAFRVPLAARWDQLPPKAAAPKPLPPPELSRLGPWLTAEPAIRRDLSRRWIGRLAEQDVQHAVDAAPKSFPDWAEALARERRVKSGDKP